jgi:hypothetical protein
MLVILALPISATIGDMSKAPVRKRPAQLKAVNAAPDGAGLAFAWGGPCPRTGPRMPMGLRCANPLSAAGSQSGACGLD